MDIKLNHNPLKYNSTKISTQPLLVLFFFIFPLIVWEELGEAARLDLLLEEVKLVEEHDEGLSLEVDVVDDGGEEVQALVHPVRLIVLVQELKRSRHIHGSNQNIKWTKEY